jgi:hypothetical protein
MNRRRALWALGAAAWLFIALFTRTGTSSSHEWSRLGTVESLVERHNFYLEESKFRGTRDRIFRNGHFYSHQLPLLATLVSPAYWILHRVGGLTISNSADVDPGYYLFVLLTNGVAFAATAVILYSTFLLAGAGAGMAMSAAFLLPLGSWLYPYAVVTNNHGISGMLLAATAHLMLVS